MSSSCNVEVDIKYPKGRTFTNLDFIQGTVHLKVLKDIAVENVQIKLEGISETKVVRHVIDNRGRRRKELRKETHELLYDVNTLFPPDSIKHIAKSDQFTLIPATYSYDFKFQIPLWAQCADPHVFEGSNFLTSGLERNKFNSHKSRNQNTVHSNHRMNPLPPSFNHFSGGEDHCAVRYFLKVTVRRASKFALNTREFIPLKLVLFDPEGQRAGKSDSMIRWVASNEIVLRKKFEEPVDTEPRQERRRNFMKRLFDADNVGSTSSIQIPIIGHGYLRSPFVLPGGDLDVVLSLMTRQPSSDFISKRSGKSNGLGVVYIQRLVISLSTTTSLTAQDYSRVKTDTTKLLDLKNVTTVDLAQASISGLRAADGADLYRADIPQDVTFGITLPNSLVQNFETCNIAHKHSLFVEIQFSTSPSSFISANRSRFQIPLKVLGGIPPPSSSEPLPVPNIKPIDDSYIRSPEGPPPDFKDHSQQEVHVSEQQDGSSADIEEDLPSYSESTK
jgi:hypothetical protein